MKKVVYLLILVFAMSSIASAESFRRTTEDMYAESYAEEILEHRTKSPAEIRAAQYRAITERCDEHHNCLPFLHVPIWQ